MTITRLTGFQPTGHFQLGNLLGAMRPLIAAQNRTHSIAMVADLHAMTVEHDPGRVRALTLEQATVLLAAGVDPDRTAIIVQSQMPEHAELHYLLECVTHVGEATRMIQFREKSASGGPVRLSLLTYPVLMAADILLYDTREVPVGEDQNQHLELARTIATRFNHRYGETFTVPEGVRPEEIRPEEIRHWPPSSSTRSRMDSRPTPAPRRAVPACRTPSVSAPLMTSPVRGRPG